MILIYVPCKDKDEAKKIAKELLQEKLVACANIIPEIISIYNWENNVEETNETVLLLKTNFENFQEIEIKVKKLHSYSIPCIMKIEKIDFNPEYKNWLMDQLKPEI